MYIVLILVSAYSLPKSMKIQNKVNKSRCRILFDRLSCYWFGVHVHACWWKSLIAYRNFTVGGLQHNVDLHILQFMCIGIINMQP